MVPLNLIAVLCCAATASAAPPDETEVWAGHQVVVGTRTIPVLGDLETLAESYVLARVSHEGEVLVLEQRPCAFRFKEVLGVRVSLSPETVAQMPGTTLRYVSDGQGRLATDPWTVGWGEEDIDQDGHPGATIEVASALCSGQIHVATQVTTTVLAEPDGDLLAGSLQIVSSETVLGASKWCLRLGSKEREDRQSGTIRYTRVPSTTTCDDLSVERWPVQAVVKQDGSE